MASRSAATDEHQDLGHQQSGRQQSGQQEPSRQELESRQPGRLDALLPLLAALVGVAILAISALGPIVGFSRERVQIVAIILFALLALIASSRARYPAVPRAVILYAGASLLLFWWLILSAAWTTSQTQVQSDLMSLWQLVTLVLALTFSFTRQSVHVLLAGSVAASSALALYVLSGYLISGDFSGHTSVIRGIYLSVAMAVGIGAVGASLQWFAARGPRWPWALAALVLLPALGLVLARGALLSGVTVTLSFALLALALRPARPGRPRWLGFVLVPSALALTLLIAFQVDFTREKLTELLAGEIGERQIIWARSVAALGEAGLTGLGLGSSGMIAEGREAGYPHNLFLQVWLEAGLVGFAGLVLIALFPFALLLRKLWRRDTADLSWLPFLGVYAFLLLEYSKSHNAYTARALFIFGLCAVWLLDGVRSARRKEGPQPPGVSFKNWR